MAQVYKLTYFNMRGKAEPIRYIFKYAGIEFEDVRVNRDEEEWPKLKPGTLFGQLPLLEHNGKTVNQSVSIARYVAKQAKIVGKDDWENLEIDAIVDTIFDLRTKCVTVHREQDEIKKQFLKEQLINNGTVPYYFDRLEAFVKKNNGQLAVGRLTWADLYFASVASDFDGFTEDDIFSKYPNLKALVEKVNGLPAIKKWIETRPKTET